MSPSKIWSLSKIQRRSRKINRNYSLISYNPSRVSASITPSPRSMASSTWQWSVKLLQGNLPSTIGSLDSSCRLVRQKSLSTLKGSTQMKQLTWPTLMSLGSTKISRSLTLKSFMPFTKSIMSSWSQTEPSNAASDEQDQPSSALSGKNEVRPVWIWRRIAKSDDSGPRPHVQLGN